MTSRSRLPAPPAVGGTSSSIFELNSAGTGDVGHRGLRIHEDVRADRQSRRVRGRELDAVVEDAVAVVREVDRELGLLLIGAEHRRVHVRVVIQVDHPLVGQRLAVERRGRTIELQRGR
jgi:hypothetical protein